MEGERGDEVCVPSKKGHLLRDAGRPVALAEMETFVDLEPAGG